MDVLYGDMRGMSTYVKKTKQNLFLQTKESTRYSKLKLACKNNNREKPNPDATVASGSMGSLAFLPLPQRHLENLRRVRNHV